MYNPRKYWQDRGLNYSGTEDEVELDYLSSAIGPCRVLEVGSGYGRIFKRLKFSDYVMCDFVDSMRDKCFELTGVKPDKWDGKVLPYSDLSFDLVIAFDVLLHVPPGDVYGFISELKRVGCNIYIATYVSGQPNKVNHVFEHDYNGLFNRLGLSIVAEKTFTRDCGKYFATRRHWVLK